MADDQQQQQQQDEELYEGDELGEGYEEEIPVDGGAVETSAEAELEAMKKKLKEMEDEAARLRALQAGATGGEAAAGTSTADVAAKEEIDARSVYVGGVDYSCTPEELQQLFQSCGTVNRVTILTDKFGSPKGFAYVEFLEVDAVSNAMLLDNTELRGRNIKVVQKRTNVPGLKVVADGVGVGAGMHHQLMEGEEAMHPMARHTEEEGGAAMEDLRHAVADGDAAFTHPTRRQAY
eukprot:CAMPEP_0119109030 /NCGR_PEP_ID=MMETSP1180-20130426/16868_1 /TAXON_ID=3052 ORGANISM="Chlamydomonas cf sp, Strain CCMP681" /NCGR_SAMPLE_ID=MMETSP1180 /ASSEMBLY_ACC=CAM_ASM_000741 /LENGTH=234 /DNA_ID=CAMNT_0007094725 /DNA_START=98 /DNA_END=803 /DNA_ORIENTATION=-